MDLDALYKKCVQCPRRCGANRVVVEPVEGSRAGFCREPSDLRIAFAGLHFGEEPLITVFGGSGTIFFYRLYLALCILSELPDKSGWSWTRG